MEKELICPVYKKCNGCQLMNMPYEQQLSWKQNKVERCLSQFCNVKKIIGMDSPYNYRNKVQTVYRTTKGGRIISGVFQSSNNGIVGVEHCLLNSKRSDKIAIAVKTVLKNLNISIYNPKTDKGFFKNILVRTAQNTGEILLTVVTAKGKFPKEKEFVKGVLKLFPKITTIVHNINPNPTKMKLGSYEKVLYGKGTIMDVLCGCKFEISPKSFYQVNSLQTEVLYKTAIKFAQLNKDDVVLDTYCGIGTIGLVASKYVKSVVGVEVNPQAVEDAKKNKELNKKSNINFYCKDASEFMTEMASEEVTSPNVVFVDPPRAGCGREFLDSLCELSPDKIVYVSCNPETLERDLHYLTTKDYSVTKIQPVDMFPHTNHIETVAVLSRKSASKSFIPVSISPKDMGLSEEKDQPTYANIRDYVQKTHGMKVSSLYVAQMKAECGLETQADRSGDKKQPKCPPEKREAILDAFRHFGLIGEDETEK
jgi:23S rRNA (uracil1939-C5)-methyltransferase